MTAAQLWEHVQHIMGYVVAGGIAWTPFASFIASKVARPAPTASKWWRFAYDFFVDVPAWTAALGRVGIFGGKANVPLVPSRMAVDNPTAAKGNEAALAAATTAVKNVDVKL